MVAEPFKLITGVTTNSAIPCKSAVVNGLAALISEETCANSAALNVFTGSVLGFTSTPASTNCGEVKLASPAASTTLTICTMLCTSAKVAGALN